MSSIFYASLFLLELAFIARAILRPNRQPAARIAWVVVIGVLPIIGILLYVFFGETNIGRRRSRRKILAAQQLPPLVPASKAAASNLEVKVPERFETLFRSARSISPFQTFGGNSARLFSVSDQMIDSLVADIEAAKKSAHLLYYIWLTDNNGQKVVEALKRAAGRGVQCRAMVDGLGSRAMIASEHWQEMQKAGVRIGVALPIGELLLRVIKGRIDLRNHRKIVVIDDHITYCGSQNCADAAFLVKAKYAPWVDSVMRFEGPIARQQQHIFAADWMSNVDEDLSEVLAAPVQATELGFPAQAFGTGPTLRHSAMPEMFEAMMYAARREIIITTPYYVPDEAMQNSLCSAAYRGVDTTVIFPARNDSFVVAAASRSYYPELLAAGVKIFEYVGGLLHSKTFIVDGEVTLIGSANMDRRSFELNYENNILFYDAEMTGELRRLQGEYLEKSRQITAEMVAAWSLPHRLWNNTIAMLGPLL